MRYLDIDLILSEDERIPCKFLVDAKDLGHLDATNEDEDLPDGARVELPLWLAKSFSENKMVELELPKHYGSKMRDAIMAGAAPINLKDFSHYYFDVGLELSRTLQDLDLQRALRAAFSGDRFRNLLLFTLANSHDDVAEYCHKLTSTELFIFTEGAKTASDLARYKSASSYQLQKASILGKRAKSRDI